MRCKLALRCEFSFHDRLNLFPSNSFSFLSFFLLLFFFFLRLRDDEKRRPVVGRWTVKEYRVRGSGRDNGWKQPLLCRWSWEGKKRKCFYFRRVRGNRDFFFFLKREDFSSIFESWCILNGPDWNFFRIWKSSKSCFDSIFRAIFRSSRTRSKK